MFQEIKKRIKNEKGLTLIELLAVIVILAIIAAIAIPAIGNIINNSRDKAILSEALNVMSGAKIAHMDGKCTEASGVYTCGETVLLDYVDGASLDGADEVTFTSGPTGGWSIKYKKFENIVNTTDYAIPATNIATEDAIKGMLD